MTKSDGLTPTERYLTKLSRRSFLSLWSHPNLYRDIGKELADLTVICGRNVIVFSDKYVKFDYNKDLKTAWLRWYNRAITHSAKQLLRAGNWIRRHPERIFFDVNCQSRVTLLDKLGEEPEIHLIAVANGASTACLRFFGGGSGSLIVSPKEDALKPSLFSVGNPGGEKAFVHVFDEANLNVILQELDTIGDFVPYLRSRRRLFESGQLYQSPSEEDLLSVYLTKINAEGEHDFIFDDKSEGLGEKFFALEEGMYRHYVERAEYKRKRRADKNSYLWDHLIESFAKNFRDGTLVPVPDNISQFDGRHGGAEVGLRYMALEPRVLRRAHSEAILGAFKYLKQTKADRFFRAMLPNEPSEGSTGFFVLLLKRHGQLSDLSYDDYRAYRAMAARAYSENLLFRRRDLARIVGIATEGDMGRGRSEDLLYQEQLIWDEEAINQANELAKAFEIFQNDTQRPYSTLEYPETDLGLRGDFHRIDYRFVERQAEKPFARLTGNRAQRRRQAAKLRKSGKAKR